MSSQIKERDKLYIIIRKDLLPGQILAQAVHCAFEFSKFYPELTKNWMDNSNYICILEVDNEESLIKLSDDSEQLGIKIVKFFESDLNNSLTAIALEPSDASKKICRKFSLALK